MEERVIESEFRLTRNFVRRGDPLDVKLPRKKQFDRSGKFSFVGYDVKEGMAIVRTPAGVERYVPVENIERRAVTRGGERVK